MKLISLALLACVLTASVVTAADATCANHPAFVLATKLLKRVVKGNQVGQVIMGQFISSFSSSTPSAKTAEELGVCSQFAGEKTCCTSQLTSFLDKASAASLMEVQKRGTPVHKLVGLVQKVLKKSACSPSLDNKSIKEVLDNAELTNLRSFVKAADDCKISFAKAVSALTRGSMCSICSGVDKVADYFDTNGKLKVSESSLASFTAASDAAITCLKDAVNTESTLTTAITELVNFYNDDTVCNPNVQATLIAKIKEIIQNNPVAPKDAEGNKKCSGKVLFNEANTCATAMDGDAAITTQGDAYTPPAKRVLADTEDAVSSPTGINAYITSNTDNSINSDGSFSVSYDNFLTTSDSSSSVSRLSFIAGFMVLLSLFAL